MEVGMKENVINMKDGNYKIVLLCITVLCI